MKRITFPYRKREELANLINECVKQHIHNSLIWLPCQKLIDFYESFYVIETTITHDMTRRLLLVSLRLELTDNDIMDSLDCGDTDLDNLRNNKDEVDPQDVYEFCLANPKASANYILFGKGEPLI